MPSRFMPLRLRPAAHRACRTALLAAASACAGAGGDPLRPAPEPPPAPAPTLRIVVAPDTSVVTRVGLDLHVSMSDASEFTFVRLLVDSGTAGARDQTAPFDMFTFQLPAIDLAAYAPGPGTHRVTVLALDEQRRPISASVTRTFALPDAPYVVTPLPDLGTGAGVRWVNARGDVAGWVQAPGGPQRPAIWTGGALHVITLPDTSGVVAHRVNAVGDVLLQQANLYGETALRVLRADGTLLPVPAVGAERYPLGADLNDARVALVVQPQVMFGTRSALFDVARGTIGDTLGIRATTLNDAGQVAGAATSGITPYPSQYLVTRGFPTPTTTPAGAPAGYCDRVGRYVNWTATDLDDSANLLASRCGAPALFAPGGPGVWADRYVGLGQVHLSRQGGLVAGLDADGGIYLWRLGTTRVQRVRLPDDAWRVDSLASVNATGALAVHAVERATGRGAALLLKPVP